MQGRAFMKNYYFLGVLAPPLSLESEPEIPFTQMMGYLRMNLSGKDLKKAYVIQEYIDLYNLRSFWLKKPLDPRGSMDENEIQEAIATKTGLGDYILDFLQEYDSPSEYVKAFPSLLSTFFKEKALVESSFLSAYFTFERELRLILAGFRAKMLKADLLKELEFEDPKDPIVSMMLVQKDAATFEPPADYESLKIIFEKYKENPLNLLKAITEYRFEKIEEMKGSAPFTVDALLAYLIQLYFVEKWHEAKNEQGFEIIESIVKV